MSSGNGVEKGADQSRFLIAKNNLCQPVDKIDVGKEDNKGNNVQRNGRKVKQVADKKIGLGG